MERAAALALIERLAATPRPAGSAEESRARAVCAELLRGHGFETREVRFSYSAVPGRWGVPMVGAVWLVAGLVAVLAGMRARGEPAAGIAFALVIIGWIGSFTLGLAVSQARLGRSRSTNLVATRGLNPMIWLCAHLDTKSQAVPTLARTVALIVAGVSAALLAVLYLVGRVGGWGIGSAWLIAGMVLASGAAVMVTCVVGNASRGAADNASGVAAVLAAAGSTGQSPLGVILTSAEELGLAGAKAWAASAVAGGRTPRLVINCDTLDKEGAMRCVVHKGKDASLAGELVTLALREGIPARVTRYTPGIMVDSAAFAALGIPAVTLSRVTLGTLGRIHTPRDTPDRLDGQGVEQAAALMSAFVRMRS